MALLKVNKQEHPLICEAYKSGKTLREVAVIYGISRERVRQILEENGLNGRDGGIHSRLEKKKQAAERKFFEKYGCSKQKFEEVKGHYKEKSKSPWHAYKSQRRNAKSRGVEWNINFWDWWCLWEESGKWESRGRGNDHYCMCRKGDEGDYSKGNVYIASAVHNSSLGRSLAVERGVSETTVYLLVKNIGGPTEVSKITGVKASYISQLCVRNIIPQKWFEDGKVELLLKSSRSVLSSSDLFEKTNRV